MTSGIGVAELPSDRLRNAERRVSARGRPHRSALCLADGRVCGQHRHPSLEPDAMVPPEWRAVINHVGHDLDRYSGGIRLADETRLRVETAKMPTTPETKRSKPCRHVSSPGPRRSLLRTRPTLPRREIRPASEVDRGHRIADKRPRCNPGTELQGWPKSASDRSRRRRLSHPMRSAQASSDPTITLNTPTVSPQRDITQNPLAYSAKRIMQTSRNESVIAALFRRLLPGRLVHSTCSNPSEQRK